MSNTRDALRARDPGLLERIRNLAIYTDWQAFLAGCAAYDGKTTNKWVEAVTVESAAYLERLGLMDESAHTLLGRLRSGDSVVRVSHQPNLFAGLNISGLNILADKAARETNSVVIFIGIDYDDAG